MPPEHAAALLGVDVRAAAPDVQRAFVRAARRTHPDLLPASADAAARAGAAAAFDDLVRARAVLLREPSPPDDPPASGPVPLPRRRGIGNSLVVLALLAFLLVGLVTLEQALRPEPPVAPSSPVSTP